MHAWINKNLIFLPFLQTFILSSLHRYVLLYTFENNISLICIKVLRCLSVIIFRVYIPLKLLKIGSSCIKLYLNLACVTLMYYV